jgi:hypothetical protein
VRGVSPLHHNPAHGLKIDDRIFHLADGLDYPRHGEPINDGFMALFRMACSIASRHSLDRVA